MRTKNVDRLVENELPGFAELHDIVGEDVFEHDSTGKSDQAMVKEIVKQCKPPRQYTPVEDRIHPHCNMLRSSDTRTAAEHERAIQQKIREHANGPAWTKPLDNFYLPPKMSASLEYAFEEIQRNIRNTNIQRARQQKQNSDFRLNDLFCDLDARINAKFEPLS